MKHKLVSASNGVLVMAVGAHVTYKKEPYYIEKIVPPCEEMPGHVVITPVNTALPNPHLRDRTVLADEINCKWVEDFVTVVPVGTKVRRALIYRDTGKVVRLGDTLDSMYFDKPCKVSVSYIPSYFSGLDQNHKSVRNDDIVLTHLMEDGSARMTESGAPLEFVAKHKFFNMCWATVDAHDKVAEIEKVNPPGGITSDHIAPPVDRLKTQELADLLKRARDYIDMHRTIRENLRSELMKELEEAEARTREGMQYVGPRGNPAVTYNTVAHPWKFKVDDVLQGVIVNSISATILHRFYGGDNGDPFYQVRWRMNGVESGVTVETAAMMERKYQVADKSVK